MTTLAQMVRAAQAAALANKYSHSAASTPASWLPAPLKIPDLDEPAYVSIESSNGFTGELEKHLSDYRNGRGELSKKTADKIGRIDIETSSALQGGDAKNFLNFSAYGSTMTYERRARYIANVNTLTKNVAALQRDLGSF